MGGGLSVPVLRLNHPGLRLQLQANTTSYSRLHIRSSDTQRLRDAEQRNRVCIDVHVKVLEGSVTGAFLAVKATTRSDTTVAPYPTPTSPPSHSSHPVHVAHSSHPSRHSPYLPPPLPVSPHEPTLARQDYLAQHRGTPTPSGDVHLRLLPRHTSNFSPASYFLTVVCGPTPTVIDLTATLQSLPYPHPPSALYFHHVQYTVDPYAPDRLRTLSDDAYIEQLQWRVVDLERELGQSNCQVLESASSLRLQRQNAALLLQVDDLRQQLQEAAHGPQPAGRQEGDRHVLLQLEAQVEQYKAAARVARQSIQELNHRMEEQAAELYALRGGQPHSHPHPHPHPHPTHSHHTETHGPHPVHHPPHPGQRPASPPHSRHEEYSRHPAPHTPLHPSQYPDAHRPAADRRLSPLPRGRPHTAGLPTSHHEEGREDGRRAASHSPAVVRGAHRGDSEEEEEYEVHHHSRISRARHDDDEADNREDRHAHHPSQSTHHPTHHSSHSHKPELEITLHHAHTAGHHTQKEEHGHGHGQGQGGRGGTRGHSRIR